MISPLQRQKLDDLWHSFKMGDKDAFATIYRQYVRDLLNYGYKVTSNRSLIEDSIQDLFFELWESRERISETTSIKFYLFQALRYKIVRNGKTGRFIDYQDVDEGNVFEQSPESSMITAEMQSLQMKHLRQLIDRLPKRQQEAINLRYYHNFSNEEVADIMGVNYQSACKFIYTALKKLKLDLKVSVVSFLIFIFFF